MTERITPANQNNPADKPFSKRKPWDTAIGLISFLVMASVLLGLNILWGANR